MGHIELVGNKFITFTTDITFPEMILMDLFVQARIQALHISKKFYAKPELASKIEVCNTIKGLRPL